MEENLTAFENIYKYTFKNLVKYEQKLLLAMVFFKEMVVIFFYLF